MGTDLNKWDSAKRAMLAALREGSYVHEPRRDMRRNQLATNEVDVATVIRVVEATRGQDARCSPLHGSLAIFKWTLQPSCDGRKWYIKGYFTGPLLHIQSVHAAGMHPEGT